MEIEYHAMLEVVRLIGEGKTWDALEVLKREATDDALLHAIDMAQFEVGTPW